VLYESRLAFYQRASEPLWCRGWISCGRNEWDAECPGLVWCHAPAVRFAHCAHEPCEVGFADKICSWDAVLAINNGGKQGVQLGDLAFESTVLRVEWLEGLLGRFSDLVEVCDCGIDSLYLLSTLESSVRCFSLIRKGSGQPLYCSGAQPNHNHQFIDVWSRLPKYYAVVG